ncbi:hypothetical protein ACWKWA_12190 [Dermacoccus abyssi]
MPAYAEAFSDGGEVAWSPYTIFFQPLEYRSAVVNTDQLGFRLSTNPRSAAVSVAEHGGGRVNLLAGSSTAFGIGASGDEHTLASLLSTPQRSGETWLNFSGRSFNSVQEYLLAALHHHRLESVDRIILLSGFNNLGLSRQPASVLDDHATFFMRQRYESLREDDGVFSGLLRRRSLQRPSPSADDAVLNLDRQIPFAVDTVARSLTLWSALAQHIGAELTFVLQPLANWVRDDPSREETEIFAELDEIGGFTQQYGEILTADVHAAYSRGLRDATKAVGLTYVDSIPAFAESISPEDWMYVDRIHFTDRGHAAFADLLMSHCL